MKPAIENGKVVEGYEMSDLVTIPIEPFDAKRLDVCGDKILDGQITGYLIRLERGKTPRFEGVRYFDLGNGYRLWAQEDFKLKE